MPVSTEQIGHVLGFTLEELAKNRVGEFSSAQHFQVVKEAVGSGVLALVLTGLVFLFIKLASELWQRLVGMSLGLLGVGILAVLAGNIIADALTGKIVTAEGPIQISAGARRSSTIQVGSYRGVIAGAVPTVLQQGERYRVYFRPYSKQLLSLEPIVSSAPPRAPQPLSH